VGNRKIEAEISLVAPDGKRSLPLGGKPMDCSWLPVLDGGKITRTLLTGETWCSAPE
jgi:hypothetical protein